MSDRVRLTVSLTPETHALFVQLAEASGMSLGRAIGEWLEDTAEGAQFVTSKMVEARRAPGAVMREMHAMAQGLLEEVTLTQTSLRANGVASAMQAERVRRGDASPPSSNTGGKSPKSKGRQQ